MNTSMFYGDSSDEEEDCNISSDEDFICDSSQVSDSDESVSSEDVPEDEAHHDTGNNIQTQTNTNSSGQAGPSSSTLTDWGPVQSKPRSFTFTRIEELAILPQNDADPSRKWPIDFYKLLLTEDIISMIVTETNRYAQQVIEGSQLTRRSRLQRWKDTTNEEMKTFFGIQIYMGLNRKPDIALYWSKSILYTESFVHKVMSRERFELLYRFLHFTNNAAAHDANDKLYKFRPLAESLISRYQAVYKPGSEIVIDESMVPFRGRLGIRQYLPGKAHKYGIKLYKICTPEAYTWNFEVHAGTAGRITGLSVTESLTVRLIDDLLNCGTTLYADNYYCSANLAEYLLTKKTYLCGTIRKSRKNLSKEVTQAKLRKKEMKALENPRGVKLYNWLDKRHVLSISTVPEHGGSLVPSGKKSNKDNDVLKPESILAYNMAKKGVDVSDQLSSYHSPLRKTKIWYKKLATEVLTGTTVVNAWVLYRKYSCQKHMSLKEFRESLVLSLTGHPLKEDVRPGRSPVNLTGSRILHTLMELSGPKRQTRKRCRGCYEKIALNEGYVVARNKARRVSTYCDQCDSKPHLCLPCFSEKNTTE